MGLSRCKECWLSMVIIIPKFVIEAMTASPADALSRAFCLC